MTLEQKPLLGKLKINSVLLVETGLHIGGGGENLDIGGLDKPVVRDPLTLQPYLPGSSIKGKLRAIFERRFEKKLNRAGGSGTFRYESDDLEDGYTEIGNNQYIEFTGAKKCPVSRLFGSTGGSKCCLPALVVEDNGLEKYNEVTINGKKYIKTKGRNHPARLIVRDAHLSDESIARLKNIDTGLYMTEWKFENGIDRITSAANPRQLERIPAGAKFNFEMVYTVEDMSQAEDDLKNLAIALAILQDDALGGHGSRGYGKIKLQDIALNYRPIEWYQNPTSTDTVEFKDIEEMLKGFGTISQNIKLLSPASKE
ncbi:MAG: hypothetical protein RLZZ148_940 [Cyanobacteriota bacterium]